MDPGEHPEKAITLLLAKTRRPFNYLLTILRIMVASAFLGLILILVLVVQTALSTGLTPLEDIRRQVEHIDSRKLNSLIHLTDSPKELAPIVIQFNILLRQIKEVIERERHFSNDIAHEFRTPIAELRSLSEIALTYKNAETASALFQDVHQIAQKMDNLVTSLLSLARFESGTQHVDYEEVELEKLIGRSWGRVALIAAEREIVLASDIPSDSVLWTDPLMMEQIFQNLLFNAVSYSPVNAKISLVYEALEDHQKISVGNLAPDLNSQDVARMFDRFWRKDPARTGGQNSGLGLTLVRAFGELLSIEIAADLKDGFLEIALGIPYQLPAGKQPA